MRPHRRVVVRSMAVLVSAAVVLGACGEDDDGDDAVTDAGAAAETWTIPASLTGMVVGGNEAGWMVDLEGRLWRVDPDGEVTHVGDVPIYNRGIATLFGGDVVIGGTRCDGEVDGESCDGDTVVELRLVDESDPESVETVEISRGPGGDFRSVGIGLEGVVDGALWIHRDTGELLRVSDSGEATRTDVPSGPDAPQPCVVDGVLYGIHNASAAPGNDEAATSPTPTVLDEGSAAGQVEEQWTVSRLDGDSWQVVSGGAFPRAGPEASVSCAADGLVVHPYATLNDPLASPYAVWTPAAGWHSPPSGLVPAGGETVVAPGTGNVYAVGGEGISRLDLDAGAVPVPLDPARISEPTAPIASLDDSGDLLIVCSEAGPDVARCVVTPSR